MDQYEVTFSVYQNAAGTIGVSNLCPGRTVVSAPNHGAALAMVKAQFSGFPKVIIVSGRRL